MPCFDPEGVIFITNKWDTITLKKKDSDDDSDDDDEEIETWESIKSDIERRWPAVKENNIFKMILTDVMQYYYYTFLKKSNRLAFNLILWQNIFIAYFM